jgi:hypothetical protein
MWRAPRPLDLGATVLTLLGGACGGGPDAGTAPSPPPEQTTGTIQVSVSTSGPAVDPDGYTIQLDDARSRPVAAQEHLVLGDVPAGRHTLALHGIARGCDPLSPRSVDLAAGETARVSLEVRCPGPATLRVITHTAGAPVDPDGYLVHVPVAPEVAIGIEDTVDMTDLPVGSQPVRLLGLAAGCSVAVPEQIIYLAAGQTTTVTYDVTCIDPAVGAIVVIVSTQSINAPSTLTFTAVLDGLSSFPVPSTGGVTFYDVTPGPHTVQLRLPSYCGVGLFGTLGTNPARVTVVPGEIGTVRFNVLCIG